MEIRWTPQAVEDIEAIRQYVGRDSAHYADLLVRRLVKAVERIHEFPKSGRVVPEIEDEAIREVLLDDYRIIYKLLEEVAEVLTVFHGARLPRL